MPNDIRQQTVYLTTGNPDTVNDSALYRGGELGQEFEWNDRGYQIVQVDSGATASTATGAVAANQLAFWKDKAKYLVTNDSTQAVGGQVANAFRNSVAGVFRTSVTSGYYCCIVKRATNLPVKGSSGGIGQTAVANSGTAADVTPAAVGTAPPYMSLGIMRGDSSGGNINVDVFIPDTP